MDVTIDINLYKKSLVEVAEILKHLNKEEFRKIPVEVIKAIDENKDSNYSWQYDVSKKLEDQNMEEYTLPLLAYLNQEYLLSSDQKTLMDKFYKQNDVKLVPPQTSYITINPVFEKKSNSPHVNLAIAKTNILKRIFFKIRDFFKGANI